MKTSPSNNPASPRRLKTPMEFLSAVFQTRCERNQAYSLSAFARDLGVSVSVLSRFMSGRRPVTLKFGMQIAAVLGLSAEETNFLVYSIMQSAPKTSKISRRVKERIEASMKAAQSTPGNDNPAEILYTTVEIERFRAIAEWYHLALLNLARIDAFDPDPTAVAKHLGISVSEAASALERLFALGLLEEKEGKVVRTQRNLYVKTEKSDVAIRRFHTQMIQKANQELQKTDPESFQQRLINGITFACNQEQIELIKDRMDRFQDEILSLAGSASPDAVYQMNFQFFPLSPALKTRSTPSQGE